MLKQQGKRPQRNIERIFLLVVTIIFAWLFVHLFQVHQRDFAEVPRRLAEGSVINLNEGDPGARMRGLLQKGYYFDDARDIELIQASVRKGLGSSGPIDNIGELNKNRFNLNADEAYKKGGSALRRRVETSRALLGFTGDDSLRYQQESVAPVALPSATDLAMGDHSISGRLVNKKEQPVKAVSVRLQMILPQDSASGDLEGETAPVIEKSSAFKKSFVSDKAQKQLVALTAYARTDNEGKFSFQHLPNDKAFEILPLQPGYQFGLSQGVQELKGDVTFHFNQEPHTLKLFSTRDFNILKKEKSLIVRTPQQFNKAFWIIVAGFFLGFFLLHLLLSIRFPQADQLILPAVMMLTGFSFVTLLSIQDPLRDRFLAYDTLYYFAAGIALLVVLVFFNLKKFTVDSNLYRLVVFKKSEKAANGWPWAAGATLLLLLTIFFGTGPEGSGVKVNLFGFQPSEIVKFLILIFLAGFFTINERFVSEYRSWHKRWSFFSFALVSIIAVILLFLILGDLGPAMVVCFTFIFLFSFTRGDFIFMAGAVILYVLAGWWLENIWLATAIVALLLSLAMFFQRKQLSESAVMILVVMAGFVLLDQVPFIDKVFPGPVHRLVERKSIWQDAWNNEVFGGDQVANGIWAMSSGGISGQGVGEGFAKTIPEAHTDMILPSIGEEFGWAGIVAIFILFLIYLHRAIIIGRQTGRPFLFYLCTGIGVSTFVQFLLIAGGSTGALPLSGVSLPFLSYGGSSLVINLIAAGFLLSCSLVYGTAVQMEYITKRQDKNLVPALVAALVGILLLTINVSRYLFNNEKWVVQPALVADRSGSRMFSYNPRIAILLNKLQAGTLYDRQGRVLATSKPELVKQQWDSIRTAGIARYNLDSAVHKRLDRFYPFAEQMFFWIGDANTGVFNGSTNGYFAEYEHAAELRGFQTPVTSYEVRATGYREDRFLPRGVREMTVSKRDFSAIAPLLLAGINSAEVEAFKKRNRDVQLTMDARLQTNIQHSISLDDSLLDNRVSVVVMEDETGDVLASAVYPLPTVSNWDLLTLSSKEQNQLAGWSTTADLGFTHATQPGSTAKVLTALAAFNKLGIAAAQKQYSVRDYERIRTKGPEPDETGTINMERALIKSNNVYFIKLANDQKLAEDMASLYIKTGMFLHGVGGYYYDRGLLSSDRESKWRALWRKTEFNTKPRYDPNNLRLTRAKGISGMAWGQGELIATPAAVARLVSGIANNGKLIANRFLLKISDSTLPVKPAIDLANDSLYARLIKEYMIKQSAGKLGVLQIAVAGKTGTPERIWKRERINDGWYAFFAPKQKGKGHVVVCIRIEGTKGSSDAVRLAGKHVIPVLQQLGYIKGFEAAANESASGLRKGKNNPVTALRETIRDTAVNQ